MDVQEINDGVERQMCENYGGFDNTGEQLGGLPGFPPSRLSLKNFPGSPKLVAASRFHLRYICLGLRTLLNLLFFPFSSPQ